jgi:hypothetical protein
MLVARRIIPGPLFSNLSDGKDEIILQREN